jgi:acyl-CoA synthetase (AMP-forming)/AMP-acid ligase II
MSGEEETLMSSTTAQSLSVAETKPRVFDRIGDLLAYYGRTNPDHDALLTPDRAALNYAALWSQSNEIVRALRAYGIRQQDRVAVVLPGGVDSAVAILGVAAGAVCVPLHPGFAANEWRRYFDELRIPQAGVWRTASASP